MAEANDNIIAIENLSVYYKNKQVLNNISCQLPQNRITVIIGQSGCGKSTFLKSINRIVEEEEGRISGEIYINGAGILGLPTENLRKQVGLVFQSPIIFPFSVRKNMLYPLDYHYRLTVQEKQQKIIHYLQVTGLYDEIKGDLDIHATKLSGGQKQRLAIARCLCIEPQILMLDEPCSALDMGNTMLIESLLQSLKQEFSIIMVTHNLSQAKRIADYVLFMDNGQLIEANDISIFSLPQQELTRNYIQYMNY